MHAHAFRHFFAKMFLKKNKDVIQLADLLGHGSVDTTRIYLQKSYDEQKETLIKTLRGSVDQLNDLVELTKGICVYDDTGHVDNDFLFGGSFPASVLSWKQVIWLLREYLHC